MTERGILFSGDMVKAILDGKKTQTRRIIRFPKGGTPHEIMGEESGRWEFMFGSIGGGMAIDWSEEVRCPYGVPGDRLWVRETWRPFIEGYSSGIEYPICGQKSGADMFELVLPLVKKSGGRLKTKTMMPGKYSERWRPSIHMPRWASRITLEVVSIHPERLNDIDGFDIVAEGAPNLPGDVSLEAWYRGLWDKINAKRASWESNPWVWVVKFKRCAP